MIALYTFGHKEKDENESARGGSDEQGLGQVWEGAAGLDGTQGREHASRREEIAGQDRELQSQKVSNWPCVHAPPTLATDQQKQSPHHQAPHDLLRVET